MIWWLYLLPDVFQVKHEATQEIKLDKSSDLVILKVVNPCTLANNNLNSLKNNKEYHGYGIKNIRKIVHKYNGTAYFTFDNSNNLFVTTIIFN